MAQLAEVYSGPDARLNQDVAIKVFVERFTGRFDQEARAIASPITTPAQCPGNNRTHRGADDRFPSSAFVS